MNDPWLPNLSLLRAEHRPRRHHCGKNRYPSKRLANEAINNRTRGHQSNRPDNLRAYPCHQCGGWHLTHRPLNEAR